MYAWCPACYFSAAAYHAYATLHGFLSLTHVKSVDAA